jgi:Zn-dependent protease with chaperone function
MASYSHSVRASAVIVLSIVCVSAVNVMAQTAIKLAKNRYTPQQDVELGLKAAEEVRAQFPIIKDDRITSYLTSIGDRLVAAAPPELKQPVYKYSFTPVNVKEINAFALPGGPMFVNRGMFDAAEAEGEVTGVMAHELAHVLLRHGTANMSKAQNPWLQIGQMAGQIGGAVAGGAVGSAIAQGSQMGLGAVLLRYSRDFEKEADLLGAQMMARAGWDPRALARMFETIERESKASGGGGTPQWLSSHPNPGNRTQYINKEATALTIANPADMSGFAPTKQAFATLPPALTMAEVEKGKGATPVTVGTPGQPVPPPSAESKVVTGGKLFDVSVPANWTELPSDSSIKVVPNNGYGQLNGQTVFTHGVEFGVAKAASRDLREATNAWLKAIAQGNPQLKLNGSQQAVQISQRQGLATPLLNPSPLGGNEHVGLYTTFLADGNLFYFFTISPEKDAQAFQGAFQRIASSLRLMDRR